MKKNYKTKYNFYSKINLAKDSLNIVLNNYVFCKIKNLYIH